MRRILYGLIGLVLAIVLVGCSDETDGSADPHDAVPSADASADPTPDPSPGSAPAPITDNDDEGVPTWTFDDLVEATCAPGAFKEDLGGDMFGMAIPVGYCATAKDGSGRLLYGGYETISDLGYDCGTIVAITDSSTCVFTNIPNDAGIEATFFLVAAYEIEPGELNNPWADVEPLYEFGFSAG